MELSEKLLKTLSDRIKSKLREHIVDCSRPEFKHLPKTLEGEILIDEVVVDGEHYGWITVTPENFVRVWKDVLLDKAKGKLDRMMQLDRGYRRFLERLKKRGVDLDDIMEGLTET